MVKDNGWEYGGEKKGFTTKQPPESALMWLACQGFSSLMSALTRGFGIRQIAPSCICYVTLGTFHLSEIQNKESHLHFRALVNRKRMISVQQV